jgi:transposase
LKEAGVGEVSTTGLDLEKTVFQAHGADASGAVIFRKQLRRDQLLAFFAGQPGCVVAMRFVRPKSAQAQGAAVVFRTRDLLVRQRTQLINALRGHLAEFGFVVRQGPGHVSKLIDLIEDPASDLPAEARPVLEVIAESLQSVRAKIATLDREIAMRAKADALAKRLMTIPGVGPVVATALVALAPPASTFRRGETSPPGWGSRRNSTPAAARSGWAGPRRWASAACDGC